MPRPSPFAGLPKFRPASLIVFAAVALTSAVLSDQPAAQALLLNPARVMQGAFWQPLSANIIVPEGQLQRVFGTLVVQWFVGSRLEGFWGPRRYLALIIGSAVVGHLALVALAMTSATAAATVVGGGTAMDLAAITAIGVVFGRQRLRLPGSIEFSMRTCAIVIVALALLAPLARGATWPAAIPELVSVVVALTATTQPWRHWNDWGKLRGLARNRKRSAGRLKIVRPDRQHLN